MTAESQPLRRELLSDQAHALIRGWIVDGRVAPGERLIESEISRQLGVSQAPVREAIKRLAHEGLVTHLPRRGSYVTEVSAEEAAQARQVRAVVEELAARQATQTMTGETLDLLRSDVAEMREAAASQDVAGFREADIKFHRRVCTASGNVFLSRIWQLMEPSLRALHIVSDPLFPGDWGDMAEQHGDLVHALESGDPDEAAKRFAVHGMPEAHRATASR